MNLVDFCMPSLGADMESGTLTQWLKAPGDTVRRGEPLAVVETEKGLIDIEVFIDGRLREQIARLGATVPVGALLAQIETDGEAVAPGPSATATAGAPITAVPPGLPAQSVASPQAAVSAGPTDDTDRRRVSPAAKRRAQELGIDLATVTPSTPAVPVTIADVERVAAQRRAAPPRVDMRGVIGAAMSRSKREIPHYYLAHTLDVGMSREWLAAGNARVPVAERLIDTVLLLKAVAVAAAGIPGFNGYWRDGRYEPSSSVNVGTAIAVRGGGLVAPALFDVDHKDLSTLMREFSDLVKRVRTGHVRSREFTEVTITLSSLGADTVDMMLPVINPPQVAIVGAGAVSDRPWVCDGQVVARPLLTITLAADHRVTDGRAGSRFLQRVAQLLAQPDAL